MKWPRFFRRRRWDEERSQALEAHLQIEIDENMARGMTAEDARYAARKKLGNSTLIREEIYRLNSVGLVETIWQDLRYAVRQLRRSPGFTAAAMLSLALGIGANTAIFSLIDQVILRRLPVRDPQQLVLLNWRGEFYGPSMSDDVLSYPLYQDIRDHNQVFSAVLGYHHTTFGVGYRGEVERIPGELVSGNYFAALGVPAALGRTFSPGDDRFPGGHALAVLSYDFWTDRFHSDRGILGQTININGTPFTVIGVLAKGFAGLEVGAPAKILVPMMMRNQVTPESWTSMFGLDSRRGRWVRVCGRLKPGITALEAKAGLQPLFHSILEMEVRQKEFARATPEIREEFLRSWMDVAPAFRGHSDVRQQYQRALELLMAMVGLVLMIACANVANLLLARAAGRRREIAVRLALGAGRGCILRQALVESLLLALMGGAAGLLGAMWIDQVLLNLLAAGDTPLGLQSTPDLRILCFTLIVCTITGLLFGLAPALGSMRVDLVPALKEGARALAGGAGTRLRRLLVLTQVFVSVLLLIGAGLFVQSLISLRTVDTGFRTQNVVVFSINPSLIGYSAPRRQQVFEGVVEKLRATPGVESAGLGITRVLDDDWWCDTVTVAGYQPASGQLARPCHNAASPGYVATLSIPLIAGRDFSAADRGSKQKVALVNESFTRHYFGHEPAVGRRFGFGSYPGTKADIEIVGVIRDAKYGNMRDAAPPQTIVDYEQMEGAVFQATIYVKTHVDPRQMYVGIRNAVHEVDGNLPVYEMRTLDQQLDLIMTTERMVANLASVFGILATVLAAIGLYGLMAFNVAGRTREIGIRMALGARSGNVAWQVMKEVLSLVVAGAALALPASWILARFVRSQLYDVRPNDPLTIGAAMFVLVIVAAMAGYIPARRAARVDPIQALRYE
jgi:predicted permease